MAGATVATRTAHVPDRRMNEDDTHLVALPIAKAAAGVMRHNGGGSIVNIASAVGLAGGISSIAGAFSAAVIGRVLDATGGNYTVVFFVCASVYIVAVAMIHLILPRTRASIVASSVNAAFT